MDEMPSRRSNSKEKSVVEVCMNMIIEVIEGGTHSYDQIRNQVRSRIEEQEGELTENTWRNRWNRALIKLLEDDKIRFPPHIKHP